MLRVAVFLAVLVPVGWVSSGISPSMRMPEQQDPKPEDRLNPASEHYDWKAFLSEMRKRQLERKVSPFELALLTWSGFQQLELRKFAIRMYRLPTVAAIALAADMDLDEGPAALSHNYEMSRLVTQVAY